MWEREDVRQGKFALTVEDVTTERIDLKIEGTVLLAKAADGTKAKRGYDVRLFGIISYDRVHGGIERFDLIALGDHWGEGPYTRGARPGRTPLGIAFELASGKSAADRVPPQAARDLAIYLDLRS